MRRAPRILVVLAVFAVFAAFGLWVWRSNAAPSDVDFTRQANRMGENPVRDSELNGLRISSGREAVTAENTGATTWSVLALRTDGRPAKDAEIRASLNSETLSATGTANWSDLDAGEWSLVVTAADGQVIVRAVTVQAGRANKTYVRLGMPATVAGFVMNSRGEKLNGHLVCFLRTDEAVPKSALKLRQLASAATGIDGRYEATIPETGRWRPVVVFGGKVLLEGEFHEVLPDGLSRRCDLVVVAKPRLLITMDGTESVSASEKAGAVSIYRASTPLEVARDQEIRRQQGEAMEASLPNETDDAEEAAAAAAGENDPKRLAQVAKQENWRRVVPEGWRNVGSSILEANSELVFDELDHDIEHRIALRRGDEVFRVQPGVFLGYGEIVRARLMPPPPQDLGDEPRQLRVCPAVIHTVPLGRKSLRVGANWD